MVKRIGEDAWCFFKAWWLVIGCSGLILAVALHDLNYVLAFTYCCYMGAAALGRWVFLSLLSPMLYAWLTRKRAERAKKEQAN